MQHIFTIDGRQFDVRIRSIKRTFEVLDGENSGRTISTGTMFRDIIGTFYNYEMELDVSKLSPGDYDELYQILSAPDDSHLVWLPYGRDGFLEQRMYVTSGTDTLKRSENGAHIWEGLKVKYVAMAAKRVPT